MQGADVTVDKGEYDLRWGLAQLTWWQARMTDARGGWFWTREAGESAP